MPHTLPMYSRAAGSSICALPGQLIAFLPVLAAALPIALAGDHVAACAFASDVSGCQAKVDQRKYIFDTVGMVFDAARMQRKSVLRRRRTRAPPFRSTPGGTPVTSAVRCGSQCLDVFFDLVETDRVVGDECPILQAIPQDDVQDAREQREVGARPHRKVEVGVAARWASSADRRRSASRRCRASARGSRS